MKIIDYLPEVLKEIYEFQVLAEAEDKQLDELANSINELEKELFLTTAEGIGLEKWEQALNIQPLPSESSQFRRFRILTLLFGSSDRLRAVLDGLVGKGNYSLDYYWNEFKLRVSLRLGRADMLDMIRASLERLVPLNISLVCTLQYRTWGIASQYSWGGVSGYSWEELAEKEDIEEGF